MAEDGKLRIALAVYQPATSLRPALISLGARGIAAGQIGLATLASSARSLLGTTSTAAGGGAVLAGLLASLIPLDANGADPVVVSEHLLLAWRSGLRPPALWGDADATHDDQPCLAGPIERCIRNGATVLAVLSGSAQQQWQCVPILLRDSSCPVQAIEYSLPIPRPDGRLA